MSVMPQAQGDWGIFAGKKPKVRPGPNRQTPCEGGPEGAGADSPRAVIGSPACTALTKVPLYG